MSAESDSRTAIMDPATSALVALKNAAVDVERLAEQVAKRDIRITHLSGEIDRLARFIMDEIEGEPSEDEGAVDTAIRLLRAGLENGSHGVAR